MQVCNVHARELPASAERVGALLDSLASPGDALWPRHNWPPMVLDGPLAPGARGGHGSIRYFVEYHVPRRAVRFRFTAPCGFDGFHGYEVEPRGAERALLRHELRMTTRGRAVVSWPLLYRPLHDALIEDSLATAEASLGFEPAPRPWPAGVRILRALLSGGRARPQRPPPGAKNR